MNRFMYLPAYTYFVVLQPWKVETGNIKNFICFAHYKLGQGSDKKFSIKYGCLKLADWKQNNISPKKKKILSQNVDAYLEPY
jgi:hypothetical protein